MEAQPDQALRFIFYRERKMIQFKKIFFCSFRQVKNTNVKASNGPIIERVIVTFLFISVSLAFDFLAPD